MLDVTLRDLDGISLIFSKSTHTAVVGSGTSTLLRKIAGELRPQSGAVFIGARDVTKLARSRRPLLYVTRDIDAPARWSLRHLLIAAVRQRSLDRIDRQREFEHVAEKWSLTPLLEQPLRTLSASERTRANIARIELLKPAILVADAVIERAVYAAELYRMLRILGTTVIAAPAFVDEMGFTDRVVVIDGNRVLQEGTYSQVYREPASALAAQATGEVNLVPVAIRGNDVDSPIGNWQVSDPPFQGDGTAAVRPELFEVANKGEESDFIFGVEEASFHGNRWRATGFLTGNLTITVSLPADTELHKGRLLPLRYDPRRFALFRG